MPRYGVVWLEIAGEHYAGLPGDARTQIDARIEQLLEDPGHPLRGDYDERTDQWTTTYGDGAGLIVYAVVHDRQRIIFVRLV